MSLIRDEDDPGFVLLTIVLVCIMVIILVACL